MEVLMRSLPDNAAKQVRSAGFLSPPSVIGVGLVGLLLSILSLSACSSITERACTLIGCDDGVSITVANAPEGPWTLEVEESDGSVHRRTCDGNYRCDGVFFAGVASDAITVRVIAEDETHEWSVTPNYERLQPNGPGCPPVCRQARIEVSL
jgi:sugar lactone lactonase YvrE